MKCLDPKCDGNLRVTHTYLATDDAKTQRMVCSECGCLMKSITLLERVEKRGDGAKAEANRIKKTRSK